ncbi:hypothetical protein ACP70R_003504 [Stipagrostis hirtigluma subsp. patula]
MYQVYMDMLRDKFHMRLINNVGEYTERAVEWAMSVYLHTSDYAVFLKYNPSLSSEERATYIFCRQTLFDEAHKYVEELMLGYLKSALTSATGTRRHCKAWIVGTVWPSCHRHHCFPWIRATSTKHCWLATFLK